MHTKKGQVTIYIIIGVILLIISGILLYNPSSRDIKVSSEMYADRIRPFVNLCLKESAEEAIDIVGIQGGYSDLKEPFFENMMFNTSYWYYDDEFQIPTAEVVEQEIGKQISKTIMDCINDFKSFEYLEISYENPKVTTELGEEKVTITMDFPITINADSTETISDFYVEVQSEILQAVYTAEDITRREAESYPFTDILLLETSRFNISAADMKFGDRVYYLTKTRPDSEKQDMFVFAMHFGGYDEI